MRRPAAVVPGVLLVLAMLSPAPVAAAVAPPNDLFKDATLVTSFPYTDTAVDLSQSTYRNLDAGEAGERTPSTSTPPSTNCTAGGWSPSRSVWYRIVPDASATLTVTLTPANPSAFNDWRIADYFVASADTLAGLSPGVCNASGASGKWPLVVGRTYYIQVTDSGSGGGTFDLGMTLSAPSYDASNVRRLIASSWASDVLDVSLLSSDAGDVHDCGAGNGTAWYTYQPGYSPSAAAIEVTTAGSTVDEPMLVVYARSTSTGTSFLRCGPSVTFTIAPDTAYDVQASSASSTGYLHVNWSIPASIDTVPPVIQWHDNIVVGAPSAAGTPVDYEPPTATDNVDGSVPVSCNPASGSVFPAGITWITCSARDQAGNEATPRSFYVRVIAPIAVTPIVPIASYDVLDVPGSGFRFWYHDYAGTITDTGRRISFGPYDPVPVVNETGGRGALTDGWSAGTDRSMLLTAEFAGGRRLEPEIVLNLDGLHRVSSVKVYGGEPPDSLNRFWAGLLSSAIVEIGGKSQRIYTTPVNGSGHTYDVIDLAGTELATIPTTRIVLRGFEAINFSAVYDTFGVSEITVDGTAVVDTTGPTISVTGWAASFPLDATIGITASASDDMDPAPSVTCSLKDASEMTIGTSCGLDTAAWALGLGTFRFTAVATDASNNLESVAKDFEVTASYPSVSTLTRQWVTKTGVAKELLSLLDSASTAERRGHAQSEASKLAEYRLLVASQSGKSIAPDNAARLIAFSLGL